MSQVRIIFDGVIAVGPPRPDRGKREGPYFGVMARSTRRLTDRSRRLRESPATYIPVHVPTIYTMTPPTGGRPTDEEFQLSIFHPRWYIWHPTRERVEFSFDGDANPRDLTYDDPSSQSPPPGSATLHSIDRVPDAQKIWPERSYLRDGLLSDGTNVSGDVASQILVPWGNVTGGGILDKVEGVDVRFSPERALKGPSRVVPNAVVTVEAKSVKLSMYSLDTGDALDSIEFNLRADTEIWISNGDPSDVTVDLDSLSREVAQLASAPGFAEKFAEHAAPAFPEMVSREALRSFASHIYTGSNPIVPPRLMAATARLAPVDTDFELFYTILDGEDDGQGLSIPETADGENFNGPNCYVNQVSTRDTLRMKSASKR